MIHFKKTSRQFITKRRLYLNSTLLFLLNMVFVFCQSPEFVIGKLVDSKTQEPIPYASIRIKNKTIGVISNFDGGFKIPFNFKKTGDTIEISSLGFKAREAFLSKFTTNKINTISLVQNIEALNEVIVTTSKKRKKLKTTEIVGLAIKKISENFPVDSFSYVGYYRDYQLKDGDYLNLNEAILAIFDPGFSFEDFKDTQIKIYKYQENKDFRRDSIASKTYDYYNWKKVIPRAAISGRIANEYTRLRLHDAIRNHNIYTYSFIDRLDVALIKNHKLRLIADVFLDGTLLYCIKISKILDDIEAIGKIYINKSNFAIHKLEYAVYTKDPPEYRKEPFRNDGSKTLTQGKLGKLLYEVNVEYRDYNDKMYLNYISFNNAFDILLPPKFTPIAAEIDSDKNRFKLVMNNQPLKKDALITKNYNLFYQKRKLTIERIEINKNNIFLYPKNAKAVFDPKLVQHFRSRNLTGVAIEIKNVRDIDGHMVNESEAISYNQFREFFTQQLSIKTESSKDTLNMIKAAPLNQNQPIVPPENLTDYWMNTPLKN